MHGLERSYLFLGSVRVFSLENSWISQNAQNVKIYRIAGPRSSTGVRIFFRKKLGGVGIFFLKEVKIFFNQIFSGSACLLPYVLLEARQHKFYDRFRSSLDPAGDRIIVLNDLESDPSKYQPDQSEFRKIYQ